MQLTINQQFAARETFVKFAKRDHGLSFEQAHEEYNRMMATPSRIATKESYVRGSRVGASFAISRREKLSLYLTLENAINHSLFA